MSVKQGVGVSSEDAAHILIFNPWVTLLGQSAYVIVIALIYWLYRPIVPPEQMKIWAAVAVIVCVFAMAVNIAFVIRRPDSAELLRFWRAIDKRTPMLFDLVAALAIILLFPHGDANLQLISVAFCVGYVPLQMISDPENTFGNRFSIVAVLGAYAAYLLLFGNVTTRALAIMMIAYGIVLFVAADAFRKVVVNAVAARGESEAAALALEGALNDVSAERDAKTRFIASASHDLGQPLQAANLFAQNLVAAKTGPDRTRAADGVNRAIGNAQSLVGDMLNHLQLESDAVVPRLQNIQLGATLARLAAQFEPAAKAGGLSIIVVPSSKTLRTDSALLSRAIGDLITNAINHSGGNRILLGVTSARANAIRIWVIDNGAGIAALDADKIFDDYVQLNRSTGGGGFGLGLASVRRTAALLGGRAGLDQRWRKGAAFFLELPVAKDLAAT